jgi:hypothetical protein
MSRTSIDRGWGRPRDPEMARACLSSAWRQWPRCVPSWLPNTVDVGDPFRVARGSKSTRWNGTGAVAWPSGEGDGPPVRRRLDFGGNHRSHRPHVGRPTPPNHHPADRRLTRERLTLPRLSLAREAAAPDPMSWRAGLARDGATRAGRGGIRWTSAWTRRRATLLAVIGWTCGRGLLIRRFWVRVPGGYHRKGPGQRTGQGLSRLWGRYTREGSRACRDRCYPFPSALPAEAGIGA